jgi:diaminopimelate epimerase
MPEVSLSKHHGLGNDFLVMFTDQRLPWLSWNLMAERLCDRRRGIGADGLIVATPSGDGAPLPDGAALGMRLYNADGSEAEMSGNGIRCLVQAWARRTGEEKGEVVVGTLAGPRKVAFGPAVDDADSFIARVDMGPVTSIGPPPGWQKVTIDAARPVLHVAVGNPHTVVAVEELAAVDLASIGEQLPDVNVEIVETGPEHDAVTMRVHERGVGVTEACGTGACAAAWAAARWSMVAPDAEITVHMEGGDAKVWLDDPGPRRLTMEGPAVFVATAVAEL